MFDTVIRAGAVVDRAIIDKEVSIGPNAVVGMGTDYDTPNRQEPGRLNTGITVVGKRAVIPAGVRLGRNVKVNEDVRPADFGGQAHVPSAAARSSKAPRRAGPGGGARGQESRRRAPIAEAHERAGGGADERRASRPTVGRGARSWTIDATAGWPSWA